MDTAGFIQRIKALPASQNQVVHVERLPARQARYGDLARPLPASLQAALREAGIQRLYTHQVQAIDAVLRGQHVVLATGTASGKTLAYNVPVLETLLADPQARALYLFPTKALARDQLRGLRALCQGSELQRKRFGAYDGDTPRSARAGVRRETSIILTNPDMLHAGILPNHTLWVDFFAHLRFVVVDEAHAYRGVFGSHVACVLRRLWRVCARYGAVPQFIGCSATIANPGEHFERLTGVKPFVVDETANGAPRGRKDFCLWNPPLVAKPAGRVARASANMEAARLFAALVQAGIRTIAFAKTRRVAELILVYARRMLETDTPELADRVRAYRAGYLPALRRQIERELRPGGGLLGVTATSALELGIDIGDLDATLLIGYPGTQASLWQQAGRSGRGAGQALSVLIGQDSPLDQYYMRHPDELFARSHEHALINPGNPYILEQHLPCAAQELPLSLAGEATRQNRHPYSAPAAAAPARAPRRALPGTRSKRALAPPTPTAWTPPPVPPGLSTADDEKLFGGDVLPAIRTLQDAGELEHRFDRWYPRPGAYPAQGVSLRGMTASRVVLLNARDGYQVMEEIDATSAPYRVHPGAVYLHQGDSYLIRELDLDAGRAVAEPVDVGYYTQPLEINDVHVRRRVAHRPVGRAEASLGEVRVTQRVTGYRRLQDFSSEVLDSEDLDLPEQVFDTVALWWDVPRWVQARVSRRRLDWAGGLHALEHAAIGTLPLFAMCDRWDIGGLSTPQHPDTGEAQIFIYDGYPGGVGLAEKGFELLGELWRATHSMVQECPCEAGCPSCVQSPKCGNNNEPLDKASAVLILAELLKEG